MHITPIVNRMVDIERRDPQLPVGTLRRKIRWLCTKKRCFKRRKKKLTLTAVCKVVVQEDRINMETLKGPKDTFIKKTEK